NKLGFKRLARYEVLTRRIEEDAVVHWHKQGVVHRPGEGQYEPLAHLGTLVGGMPPMVDNYVQLLGTGGPVLEEIIKGIDSATHHCHLLFYIWMPAGRGVAVGEALIRAVKRGVVCRVLVDAVGAKDFLRSGLCEAMREGGVKVVAALPVNPLRMLFARIDLRNHRKIVVIDGVLAITGSQNLTDETFAPKRGFSKSKVGPWVDSTIRLQGPAVQALQCVFLRDWLLDSQETLESIDPFFPVPIPRAGKSIVHVVPSGPGPRPDAIHQAMMSMFFEAREEIVLTTPYFVPDEATKAALQNAALRGVDVTLIVPDELDAKVAAASRAHYQDLLDAGVKVLEHEGGLLHAKTASIDRRLAVVGSANLDMRSFWLNFETTLFIHDEDFASQLRFMQMHYASESRAIVADEWARRPVLRRLVDHIAQLFSPLL
ncbi:MAG: cardiolipin synthase, partial [Phycisphaerales bacterium]